MNKCYFCGKECGETVLTVNDKTLFQSELFRAYMCAGCSEAVHSALILLRTRTNAQPVVRCKDCKHRTEHHYEEEGKPPYIKYSGEFTKYPMSDGGFCSFGARMDLKDGDTNG